MASIMRMMRIAATDGRSTGTRAGCSSAPSRRSISSRSSPPPCSSCRCWASTASSRWAAGCSRCRSALRRASSISFPKTRVFRACAWLGVALAAFALSVVPQQIGSWASAAVWAALWLLYLSFVNVGQTFYGFGWETLLCEVGFFTIFAGASRMAPNMLADLDLAMDAVPPDVRRRPDQAARRFLLARSHLPRTTTSKRSRCRIR